MHAQKGFNVVGCLFPVFSCLESLMHPACVCFYLYMKSVFFCSSVSHLIHSIRKIFEIYVPRGFFISFSQRFLPCAKTVFKIFPRCHSCTSFEVCTAPFTNICRVKIRIKHFKKPSSMNVNRVVGLFYQQSKYKVRVWINVCLHSTECL